VRRLIWRRLLVPKDTIWSSAQSVMEKGDYPSIVGALMSVEIVGVLDSLRGS